MTTRYKPGSRLQDMWAAHEKGGAQACYALGPTLKLAATTIKAWARKWDRERGIGLAPKTKSPSVKTTTDDDKEKQPKHMDDHKEKLPKHIKDMGDEKKLPKHIKGYKFNPTGKQRVRCDYMPTRLGWLIEAGLEASRVCWDDNFGETIIINKFLKKVTNKEEIAHKEKYPIKEDQT
jgi:hypothetical protein